MTDTLCRECKDRVTCKTACGELKRYLTTIERGAEILMTRNGPQFALPFSALMPRRIPGDISLDEILGGLPVKRARDSDNGSMRNAALAALYLADKLKNFARVIFEQAGEPLPGGKTSFGGKIEKSVERFIEAFCERIG